MRRILLGLLTVGSVVGITVYATNAFFSDVETSNDNIFTAGNIDLGIDNHSYYNGVPNPGTTWRVDYDISDDPARQFFNFTDVKPGDWGEDTISLHVKDNDSWLCADVKLTSDDENDLVDPEADDGDVTEGDETLLPSGTLGTLAVDQTATVALADSATNIWTGLTGDPLTPDNVRFVAKAWCFGNTTMTPYLQDGGNRQSGPDDRPVVCDGSQENNVTQSDSLTADVSFRAVQSRNNLSFLCNPPAPTPTP